MRNFWDLNYGEVGFEFFGRYHFTCIFIIFIFAIILYKPWKNNKNFRKVFAIMPITLEIIRLIIVLMTGHYDSSYLPFHLCLFGAQFMALDVFFKSKFIRASLFFLFMPAAILSLITPGWTSVNRYSYVAIISWIIHGANSFYPIYLVLSKKYKPKLIDIIYPAIFIIAMLPIIRILNKKLSANYFFIEEPYIGSPLEVIKNVFPNYILGLFTVTIFVMVMTFFIYKLILKLKI
ncbi:YwaF family protein [Peptoniphilus sp. AGMB00490]|uniref:YwaF family protein n=1 Tax=Peptoniphilus faecalis TaxID=2731255 RepID=A0A848RN64_9FIRM|nr:YwaF family protein [Peptoniphilus faecalis]NMW85722.1 YwaF family protein [Peptoniphilus faecalis]